MQNVASTYRSIINPFPLFYLAPRNDGYNGDQTRNEHDGQRCEA